MDKDRLNKEFESKKVDLQNDAVRLNWKPEELEAVAQVCAIDEIIGSDRENYPEEIALREQIMNKDAFVSGFCKLMISLRAGLEKNKII